MRKIGIFLFVIVGVIFLFYGLGYTNGKVNNVNYGGKEVLLDDLVGMTVDEVIDYVKKVDIELDMKYQYSASVDKDIVIAQNVEVGTKLVHGNVVEIVVSKGAVPISLYQEYKVNELGKVPIMMYHGIVNVGSDNTDYVGGNVDKDGYNRTVEAFREDLEFYYQNGYRMIRLEDYVDGNIDVDLGLSPIILTFDDGSENNFKVLGEKDGNLIIDPNCAVGILEEFKKKYPDYGVTATFFVNGGLFNQEKYNEKILRWLVDNGYDVGNHTMTHVNFTKVSVEEAVKEVGELYQKLEMIIPNEYVSIVALPFGSPYNIEHVNYKVILNGEYGDVKYQTKAALRVGWEAEVSCFDIDFVPTFLKRIRAYDNEGRDFDVEMNFKLLEKNRYISDGDVNTVVVLDRDKVKVNDVDREIIVY